ncbi:hypothetical protein [Leucobacter japonicus]|uniref:hypothetical protein n=1 Tax=Leucobacter japonicus TaxID=1461259 RepID=UPI0006A7EE30|nr:hypothetical protein [Leucobacter japonicus]
MNPGEIIIAAVGAVGGVGGAIFAWVQAATAVSEREEAQAAQAAAETAREAAVVAAQQSASAAVRQANALEEANALLSSSQELAKLHAPPAWSQAEYIDQNAVKFTNSSGKHVLVTRVAVEPDESATRTDGPVLPHRVENGDAFAIRWWSAWARRDPEKVVFEWHYENEPSWLETTERNL